MKIVSAAVLAACGAFSLALAHSPAAAEAGQVGGADAGPLSDAARQQGRELFLNNGCSQCHTLTDAEAYGSYAPSLDNPELTQEFVLGMLMEGRGDMQSFAGILSEEELAHLASYVAAAAQSAEPQ